MPPFRTTTGVEAADRADAGPADEPRPAAGLIGRSEVCDAVARRCRERRPGVIEVYGAHGMGKRSLLTGLPAQLEARGVHPRVVPVQLDRLSLDHPREGSGPVDLTALIRDVAAIEAIVRIVASPLAQDDSRAVHALLLQTDKAAEHLQINLHDNSRKKVRISNATGDVRLQNITVDLDGAEARQLNQRSEQLLHELAARVDGLDSSMNPLVVTVFGIEHISGYLTGHWFNRFLRLLRRAVVVVTRSSDEEPHADDVPAQERYRLGPFSPEEVAELMRSTSADWHQVPDGAVRLVHDYTEGHPDTVRLVLEYLGVTVPGAAGPAAFRDALAQLPPEREQPRQEMVRAMLAGWRDPELRAAAEQLAILRTFDEQVAVAVLEGVVDAAPDVALSRLRSRGFVEKRQASTGLDGLDEVFAVPKYFRLPLAEWLRDRERSRFVRLHRRSADTYYALLEEFDEEKRRAENPHAAQHKYEDALWQTYVREWLYHARVTDRCTALTARTELRRRNRLRLLSVFLGAFWWWGCYLRFPFCDELLQDWRDTQEDTDWLADLTSFHEAYPTTWPDPGPRDSWLEVRRSLLLLRRHAGIDGPTADLDQEERYARALLDVFLAHSYRFVEPTDAGVETHYAEAEDLLAGPENGWDRAWVVYERADAALEAGNHRRASQLAGKAVSEVLETGLGDRELLTNLLRLRAGLDRVEGNHVAAVARDLDALRQAFLNLLDPKDAPDDYTVKHYREVVDDVAARLAEMASGSEPGLDELVPVARAGAARLLVRTDDAMVRDLLGRGDPEEISHVLFPPAPVVGEPYPELAERWAQVHADSPPVIMEAATLRGPVSETR